MCLWTFTSISPGESFPPFVPCSYPWLLSFPSVSMKAFPLLTMLLFLFFNFLGETGRPQELVCVPAESFPLDVGLCYLDDSWLISQCRSCLFPCRAMRGPFSGVHGEHLVGFLEGKPMKVWDPSQAMAPMSFSQSYYPLSDAINSSHSPFKCSCQFKPPGLQLWVRRNQLLSPSGCVCLCRFVGDGLPWNLNPLIDPREVTDL